MTPKDILEFSQTILSVKAVTTNRSQETLENLQKHIEKYRPPSMLKNFLTLVKKFFNKASTLQQSVKPAIISSSFLDTLTNHQEAAKRKLKGEQQAEIAKEKTPAKKR